MPSGAGSFFNSSSASDTAAELNASARNRSGNGGSAGNRTAGQQPRQNSVVVSSAEIGRLFDMFAEVSNTVKRQEETITKMAGEVGKSRQETAELREDIASFKGDYIEEESNAGHYGPLPKEVKEDVRTLHNKQDDDNQYRGNERIDTPHNSRVRHFLVQTIFKDNTYDKATIKRAATRYYETKRQQHLDSLPERKDASEKKQKDKALTSRRRRLYVQRIKVASDEEKEMLNGITHNFMSDEEDGDERDVWVVRSPSWRSAQLNTILARLQERASSQEPSSRHPKYKRVRGRPSTRPPPSNAASWAVNAVNQAEPEEEGRNEPEPEDPEIEPPLPTRCSTPSNSTSDTAPDAERDDNDRDEEMPRAKRRKTGKKNEDFKLFR